MTYDKQEVDEDHGDPNALFFAAVAHISLVYLSNYYYLWITQPLMID